MAFVRGLVLLTLDLEEGQIEKFSSPNLDQSIVD